MCEHVYTFNVQENSRYNTSIQQYPWYDCSNGCSQIDKVINSFFADSVLFSNRLYLCVVMLSCLSENYSLNGNVVSNIEVMRWT